MKHFRPGLKPDHTRVWSGTLHSPGITSWHDDNEFFLNIDHRMTCYVYQLVVTDYNDLCYSKLVWNIILVATATQQSFPSFAL